ncbi:hypothetical protein Tsubulata_007013 [Turnera subulata]|uniref:Glycosyltransferase n=1 Tax=Turnera subulata TaxID=218843 RepID=A0A9Q0EZS7_9ROSI|nr:hypothetical protein Tsubulata_007013 [Turnera subulata]
MASGKENIVLFPFMAQGHILPFLSLAQLIEQKENHTVNLISTPLNIKKIKQSLPPTSSISLLEIPFNSSEHGLPPNSENTDALPPPLFLQFLMTSHSFKHAFRELISTLVQDQGRPPLCIIADIFFPWTAEIAREFGSFNAIFSGAGGYGLACYHSLWSNLPKMGEIPDEFSLPGFPEGAVIRADQIPENLRFATVTDSWAVFQQKVFNEWLDSDGLLINTVEDFDHLGLKSLREQLNLPVWPIGPVHSLIGHKARGGKESSTKWEIIEEWLDNKPSGSVLYISFGSQSKISASQMMHLALALESTGKNFIWIVRPPVECDISSEFKADEWLPEGFEERMVRQNKGLLVSEWAPQLNILSHRATSTFLSHCGWNSVMESLSNAVPLIAWPLIADQHFNAKMLEEEVGVCVQVATDTNCGIRQQDLQEKIELVMEETEKGMDMRRKARKVKKTIENAIRSDTGLEGSSVKALDAFLLAAGLKKEGNIKEYGNGF